MSQATIMEALDGTEQPTPAQPAADHLTAGPRARASLGEAGGTSVIERVRDLLRGLPAASSEAECTTRISLLEDLKSAAVAAQARETVAFVEARHAREAAEGLSVSQRGKGLGSEIALARRESPNAGSRFLGMSRTLSEDMPHAMTALTEGKLTEFGATVLVKEVIALPTPARVLVDERMAERYGNAGIKSLTGEARALANQIDPRAQVKRHQLARTERRVTVRPAPDSMAYLTALLPITQAFACKKSLIDAAATLRAVPDGASTSSVRFTETAELTDTTALDRSAGATGVTGITGLANVTGPSGSTGTGAPTRINPTMEPRSSAQAEADILVERLTGQSHPDAIPVELHLVMTDTAVFGTSRSRLQGELSTRHLHAVPSRSASEDGSMSRESESPVIDHDGRTADPAHASAWIPGIGPLSAVMARDLLDPRHDHPQHTSRHEPPPECPPERSRAPRRETPGRVFLRRVLLDPVNGEIAAMDTGRRAFTGTLRRALLLRDDRCRTPWCGAPIVHIDHTHPHALGGRTNAANGTGLCARCNYTKEYRGWEHRKDPGTEELSVTTPTGHRYQSGAPPLLPRISS